MDSKEEQAGSSGNNDDSSYPLIWVLSENSQCQEPALLIEEYDQMHLIEWKNTGEREFVESHRVSRRRKRGLSTSSGLLASSSPATKRALKLATTTNDDDSAKVQPPAAISNSNEQKQSNHDDDDDDDDDEVQVLLTILPPSPAKPTVRRAITPGDPAPIPSTASRDCNVTTTPTLGTRNASNDSTRSDVQTDGHVALSRILWAESNPSSGKESRVPGNDSSAGAPSSSALEIPAETNTMSRQAGKGPEATVSFTTDGSSTTATITDTAAPSRPTFSSRSSAYLQSLAEICYSILWDVRWRVGGTRQERLLAWERGDDLSAVHALARRYLHVPRPPPPTFKCTCLLCDIPDVSGEEEEVTVDVSLEAMSSSSLHQAGNVNKVTTETSNPQTETPSPSTGTTDTTLDDDEEAYDRCLNLYARLYTRKGPWFRVDDLFKYYIPRRPQPDEPEETATDGNEPTKPPSPVKPTSPSKFFLPVSAKAASPSRKKNKDQKNNNKAVDTYIDQDFVNCQLEAVATLLQDIQRLFGMGLIRSFRDEQECGMTIGQIQKYGLLRQEEQRAVLAKLGGARNNKQCNRQSQQRRSSSSSGNNSSSWTNNKPNATPAENLIWKQMCQQQSILAQAAAAANSTDQVLLPVAKHADNALIASWATSLVLRAGQKDYIPQPLLRSVTTPVQQVLRQLLKDYLGKPSPAGGISLTCLRLREAPLKSLRRCCRLYLCATSGPGEMRGDTGTNAWKSLPSQDEGPTTRKAAATTEDHSTTLLPPTNMVAPPGAQSWHHTVYPGRDYRFKLISCPFQRAHVPLFLNNNESSIVDTMSEKELALTQVFSSVSAFELWELSVTIRSVVDYLLEANELSLYNERKRARVAEDEATLRGNQEEMDYASPVEEFGNNGDCMNVDTCDDHQRDIQSSVDFLHVLTLSGRQKILERFALGIKIGPAAVLETKEAVEKDVETLLGFDSNKALPTDQLKSDCERVLGVIGILAGNILALRHRTASVDDVDRIVTRPWLRHLWWEGCIAYLLWDIIPTFERRGYYQLATYSLEILLFGNPPPRHPTFLTIPKTLVAPTSDKTFLAQAYLSRRARGKAFERLVIDYMHILRQQQKENIAKEKAPREGKKKRKRTGDENLATQSVVPTANDITAKLCDELIKSCVSTGQITFCAARTLARRLKQPLSDTLFGLDVYEINHLGHRLACSPSKVTPNVDSSTPNGKISKKYSDWSPTTDYAVANAMATDRNAVGGRCSFVGMEEKESESSSTNFGSLNVEELALEYYSTGRLPVHHDKHDVSPLRGGWVGWHDEGGKLRALFRILSATAIFGTDWGCLQHQLDLTLAQNATIHLTPYQGAPFDLHVGAEQSGCHGQNRMGFYERRRAVINKFLARLEQLGPVQVAELVYRSIASRFQYATENKQTDPMIERDIQQARTLSGLAAGLGGKMLAALCRCLFFDYRHYSGGLPDLTLMRAVFERDETHNEESLVDLGAWIGEGFSPEQLAEKEANSIARMFEDQDEEFLGCSKVGDSGRRNTRGGRLSSNRTTSRRSEEEKAKPALKLPDKLLLRHDGRKIRVECMLVEVKSQNDRLDPRQEDWLNVLDSYGNVRVCKFGAGKKDKQKSL